MRLCHAGPELSDGRSSPWIGTVNPVHLCRTPLPYDVKWAGRVFLLVAAGSQYASSLILLVRRLQSSTNAAVDTAKLVLVVSGTVDLVKSLLLLAENSRWTVPNDGFTPCLDASCGLNECVAFKKEQGAPDATQPRLSFTGSRKLVPYLQWLLTSLVSSNLLRVVLSVAYAERLSFWNDAVITLMIFRIWEIGLNFLCRVFIFYDLAKGIIVDTEPQRHGRREHPLNAQGQEGEEEGDSPPTTMSSGGTLPGPATLIDRSTTRCSGMDVLLGIVMPAVGLVIALFGLGAILFQLLFLVMPSTLLLAQAVEEMLTWAAWAVDKPCPQLWKDELEDLLWSF